MNKMENEPQKSKENLFNFKCSLCHFDYTKKVFGTNNVRELLQHYRKEHKTTGLNVDRIYFQGVNVIFKNGGEKQK